MDSRPSTALVSRGPEGTTPRITDLELRSPTRNTCSCRQPGCSRRAWGAQAIHHGLLCFAPCPPTAVHQVRRRRRRRQRDTSGCLLAGLWLVSGHGQGISPSRTTCPSGTIGMLVALPRGVSGASRARRTSLGCIFLAHLLALRRRGRAAISPA